MAVQPVFESAADRWGRQIADRREYSITRDGNVFAAGLADTPVFRSDYEKALLLRDRLLTRYRDSAIEEVFSGCEEETAAGPCFVIRSTFPVEALPPDPDRAARSLLSNLRLIPGIGPCTEAMLQGRGYHSITDLCRHPRFHGHARALCTILDRGDTGALLRHIARRHSASHPLALATSGFFQNKNLVFLDIETLGLCSRPVILVGIGRLGAHGLSVSQYLLRDIGEEEAALLAVSSHFTQDRPALVTFNGKSFDMPYLAGRIAYYGYPPAPSVPHYDMLHFSRRGWKGTLPDFRLGTLEARFCSTVRTDDVPSAMVPEFYETYMRTGNPGPLVPIVEHNRRDIISLARLFLLLREDIHADG
ncbi:MAG: ribonuclease H-like domain-containing protein [Methanomicrobiaceae archaeon]|nr:ribonuclease H-like domain-containing protein [Methanomicrobiaceae archaeon]